MERTEDELDLEFAMVASMVIVEEAVDSTSGFVENCAN